MKSVTFKIEGMHCESCARTIQTVVGAEDGVREVDVSFDSKEARVLYDPAKIDEDRIAGTVERPGFRVTERFS